MIKHLQYHYILAAKRTLHFAAHHPVFITEQTFQPTVEGTAAGISDDQVASGERLFRNNCGHSHAGQFTSQAPVNGRRGRLALPATTGHSLSDSHRPVSLQGGALFNQLPGSEQIRRHFLQLYRPRENQSGVRCEIQRVAASFVVD